MRRIMALLGLALAAYAMLPASAHAQVVIVGRPAYYPPPVVVTQSYYPPVYLFGCAGGHLLRSAGGDILAAAGRTYSPPPVTYSTPPTVTYFRPPGRYLCLAGARRHLFRRAWLLHHTQLLRLRHPPPARLDDRELLPSISNRITKTRKNARQNT